MKKKLIICIATLSVILLCAIIGMILKNNINSISENVGKAWEEIKTNKQKSAIEKAVEQIGDCYDWSLVNDKENDVLKIILYKNLLTDEYKKTGDIFEEYLKNDDEYSSYEKVEIIFADHNSKLGRLAVRNFEEDGTLHQHFDIVKVGSKNEGYSFDISIPDGEYIRGFKKLEIGEYDLKDTKWILFHFRDLEIASCHLNEMDYLELCDFFCDVMPNCKIIN